MYSPAVWILLINGLMCTLLEGLLRSHAHQAAFLEIRESNQAGMGLYTASGFEVVGRREGYYRDGEDALLMRRNSLLG